MLRLQQDLEVSRICLRDLTKEEREESVIRLYNEGKTTREIAKLMRMSLRDIGGALCMHL
jgi:DNA-binding NarL/FixJ family response regulator